MTIIVADDASSWIDRIVELFTVRAQRTITSNGRFTCALTGGSAVGDLYRRLALAPIDWSRVLLYWGDERAVPPDHADSNFRLAKETLLHRARVPRENVHRMRGEDPDLAAAAADYEKQLPRDGLDLVLLGMGPDGHVCSLFPKHPLLAEHDRLVSVVEDSPKPPARRMTLTMGALRRAREVWFVVQGATKAAAVREAIEDPRSELPAAMVHRTHRMVVWTLDRAAANLLERSMS
jgi:6-phosphogluconolactonase